MYMWLTGKINDEEVTKEMVADIGYALRSLLRQPVLLAGAVISLALCLGANVAIFTCVNAILLRPLPVSEPERLVMVYGTAADAPGSLFGLSHLNYLDFRRHNDVFSSLLVFRPVNLRLSAGSRPEIITGEMVSGDYFRTLGVRAVLGRTFGPDEDSAPGRNPVVVLSHGLWQRRFGSDSQMIGKVVRLNGHGFTVVGVAPQEFRGLGVLGSPDLWVPTAMHQQVLFGRIADWYDERDALILNTVGRLKPGVSLTQADSAMKALAGQLAQEYPVANKGVSVSLVPLSKATIHYTLRDNIVFGSGVLMVLVGLLLLIACANVANLLLLRALERRKEIAVRISIGAGRSRLARQFLAEAVVLSALGVLAGLPLALGARKLLWALRPPIVPDSLNLGLDLRVLGFTLVLCLFTGLLFGLVPLTQTFRFDYIEALKGSGALPLQLHRRFGLRQMFVVAQVALSFLSLVGAGVFLVSLGHAQRIDPGFETERLALATVDLGIQGYDEAKGRELQRQLVEKVAALPGVQSASLAERVMLDLRGTPRIKLIPVGQAPPPDEMGSTVSFNTVGPVYFETLGVRLVQGRSLTADDRRDGRRVAVVNEAAAARFWPGRSAVGRSFRLEGEETPIEIVGVARNCSFTSLGQRPEPYLYLPLLQRYVPAATLHVRTLGDPTAMLSSIRTVARSLDPDLPLSNERTMRELVDQSLWASRTAASLLALLSLVALVLAATGIYSTMAYSVDKRLHEIGIRMALGASRVHLIRYVLRESFTPVAVGVAIGWLGALLALPRVLPLLFDAGEARVLVFATAFLSIAVVSLLANLFPTRRALRIEPRWAVLGE
jgi:predicted permease